MSFQAASLPHPTHNMPTIWRSNSALVMTKQALLPQRCVKCNAPTQHTLKRNLRWHHPALYLVIFGGVLLYFILSLVLSKSATIHIGLCETHAAARKRDMLITCVLVLLSFGSFCNASQSPFDFSSFLRSAYFFTSLSLLFCFAINAFLAMCVYSLINF